MGEIVIVGVIIKTASDRVWTLLLETVSYRIHTGVTESLIELMKDSNFSGRL